MANVSTVQGQAWDILAKKHFHTEKAMLEIIPQNADMADTLLFSGHLDVILPEKVSSAAVQSVPPWEREA